MHASIWHFTGDPDELLRGYDAMLADVPRAAMRLHACLRTAEGIVVVDTCPDREAFEGFTAGALPMLLSRHGLPAPAIEDAPVHRAFVDGVERR